MFERNIRRFFLQTRVDLYIKCGQKNIEDFYLHISNLYNTLKNKHQNEYFFNLETLSDFFDISNSLEPRKQKNKINYYLKNVISLLKDDIKGLDFEWVSPNGKRWKYTLKMTWTPLTPTELAQENNFIMNATFLKILRRNLFELYQSQYGDMLDTLEFWQWLKSNQDEEIKIASYVNTLAMHQKLPKYPSAETLAISFFRKLKDAKSVEDIENNFIAKK